MLWTWIDGRPARLRARAASFAGALTLLLAATAAADEVHYFSGWSQPYLHYEGPAGWTSPPGIPMRSEGNGWWRADTQADVQQLLFTDGRGGWDHAPWPEGPHYKNKLGADRIWVKNGRLTYAAPQTGRLERHRVPSQVLPSGSRDVIVYLPGGYDTQAQTRYPVLYLQDGQNLFDPQAFWGGWAADKAADDTAISGAATPIIIVGIHNSSTRMSEYTPTRDPQYGGGGADRYLDFVESELKPYIDGRFRTRPGRETTAIGGSSLGGLLALHAALTRSQTFGRVLAMSPSLWWDGRELLLRAAAMSGAPNARIYLDSGGPSDGQANTNQMRDLLAQKGLRFGVSLWHWTEPSHQHNEAAWRERLPRALSYLFPPGL